MSLTLEALPVRQHADPGFRSLNVLPAETALHSPMLESRCRICRLRLDASPLSASQTAVSPTLAAAMYEAAALTTPPTPAMNTDEDFSRGSPASPQSGSSIYPR